MAYGELYTPRKCSFTNRLVTSKDHAAIQINFAQVDANGVAIKGKQETFVVCGYIRANAQSDIALSCLAQDKGLVNNLV